ncbi:MULTISPECIES: hypothetical protein [Methanobacterium]|jgi:hypothetical protein|uniref:Uncharacterized protein n=1 Tax=Methanobacterium veterum TaxID=408577 RepID=A0A9E5DLX2_9EURY|nr:MULTISPECIES: hypothetical protein [Methanobacterium]MCZ3364487.1 hypothetical protein [Methanobacterium veterum]MCZ3372240.1 hypothetical protein [Methanobacterium veterum]
MKDSKKNGDQKPELSDDINVENMDVDLILKKAEEAMEISEFMIKELEKGNVPIPDKKDVEFKILSHATLISIIKDLQSIGIEGKNPKKVLKELKKLRASRE